MRCTTQEKEICVVFDCGASFSGTSLNSELLQGPDITNRLIGVLTRFHHEPIGIMGDIQAMFHQVKVSEQDVGGDLSFNLHEYRMTVHLFHLAVKTMHSKRKLRITRNTSDLK